MNVNKFFKPTLLYKEFMILDLIEKNKNITQREMSNFLGVAVSMVNNYLDDFESKGMIKRKRYSSKTVAYFVTTKGIERKKVLNIAYLNSSLKVFKSAKQNIVEFLSQIIDKGFKKILLYGAGEVAEILLQTLAVDKEIPITVIAIIDDDQFKQYTQLVDSKIISIGEIYEFEHDGILISSYSNREIINRKLIDSGYNKDKIIHFFK